MSIQVCREPRCSDAEGDVRRVIASREKDLGDFSVRRVLPSSEHPRVGPFVFFDHFGPTRFAPGRGLDVRPHPHIGLATLTYLFDGAILHRDSLGSVQRIAPGAVNWMTAGRGIVHSERTPDAERAAGSPLHGLQLWIALPLGREEIEPAFAHHPAGSLPAIARPGVALELVAGEAFGARSPVETASETWTLAGRLEAGAELALPEGPAERAVYVAEGGLEIGGAPVAAGSMAVLRPGPGLRLRATADTRLALVGGAPLEGPRHLWWNLVSSSRERIERAKRDWREGRFPPVPGDDEFIPLPED